MSQNTRPLGMILPTMLESQGAKESKSGIRMDKNLKQIKMKEELSILSSGFTTVNLNFLFISSE